MRNAKPYICVNKQNDLKRQAKVEVKKHRSDQTGRLRVERSHEKTIYQRGTQTIYLEAHTHTHANALWVKNMSVKVEELMLVKIV